MVIIMNDFYKLPLEHSTKKAIKVYGIRILIFLIPTGLLFLSFFILNIINGDINDVSTFIVQYSAFISAIAVITNSITSFFKVNEIEIILANQSVKISLTKKEDKSSRSSEITASKSPSDREYSKSDD